MFYESKIKNKQITMVVMTVLALVVEILSLINRAWISEAAGRICQFFHWGYYKIFNGLTMPSTSYEVYLEVSRESGFRAINPALTLEILIMFAFIVLVACPLGILIEIQAKKHFAHFVGLNRLFFALSAIAWLFLPVIVMQFFPKAPIELGLTHTGTVVVLHIWFYFTLTLYLLMIGIFGATSRAEDLNYQHIMIEGLWGKCAYVWYVVGKVTIVVAFFGFILVYWILKAAVRSST